MEQGHTPVMADDDREQARALSLRGVRPPLRVPGYEQEAFLGHGAYGEVWVAVDSNSGRKVAIKFYTRRGGLDWAALAREVEKLRYLFSDRYVVQLLKVGWEADPPYYVMEYMENGSLEDLLRAGPLSIHDAVALFREIAVALVHAHNKGILHCDLKPANILLDHDRHPRLADFGQSRLTNDLSPALGTLFYMAPEQADLKAAPDARWDVYALGAVMYRMLTGQPPHRDEPGAATVLTTGKLDEQLGAYRKLIESSSPPSAHRRVPGVDAVLAGIVDRCLAASPSRRYPNPQAVLSDLDAWSLRRVRRPLLVLTGFGFTVLLLMMALLGSLLFHDTVSTAEQEVIDRTLEGNRFAAKSAAERFAVQIQYRWQVLEQEAKDRRLRDWLKADSPRFAPQADELDAWLGKRKEKYDRQFDDNAKSSIWFADDRRGLQYGTAPPYPLHRFQYRGFRDYFHGQGKEFEEKTGPPPGIIRAPHRSVVFRRKVKEKEEFWSVAFSVPVWPGDEPGGEPVGILGMTLDLKGQTKIEGERERFAVLVDTRPDATGTRGLILRHPYLERYKDTPSDFELPVYYAEDVVQWVTDGTREFAPQRDYQDPVGGEFAGSWLAAAAAVQVRQDGDGAANSGWVIVVQERREEVLEPVRQLQWRLGYGAAAAVVVVIVLVLAMWGGMMYLLDASSRSRLTRFLRKWAGLPTAGTGATGTGTGGSVPGTGPTPSTGTAK